MKIIKCSIENYGTLNKYEYNFNDGLNIINEENGFGKSTLASFIKAMFYGLPNSGSKSIKSSERKKYLPWNGGKFGGSLDFSYKEKEYRIERFFGSTASQDKFKLIDLKTNLKSNDFTEKIGEEIFLLDVSSFEKSSFFPQNDLLFSGISDDIQKKLTSTIEQSKDSSGYLEAKAILEKQKRDFYTNKNKGLIVENDSEIERLKRDIDRLRNLSLEASNKKDFIKNKNIDLNNLEKKHFEVKNQISESSKNIINKVTKDKYLELVNTQDNYLQEIKRIENLGLVNNEDLKKIEKAVEEQKVLKNSCDILNVELKKLDSVQNVNINDISETTENIKDLEKCIYKKQALEENYYISFVNEEEIKNIE